jgi:hypothetical protein
MESPIPADGTAARRAAANVPIPAGELLQVAQEYERAGRWQDAKRLLDHILRALPQQGDALHLAGIVAYRLGDPSAALDLMERSLRFGLDTPLYMRNICEIYRVMGRLDEALQTAQRATALAPLDPLCLQNQAIIHYHRLEPLRALDCATRALRINPGLPGAHFARAEALLLLGDMEQGWEEYEWRFRIATAAPLMPPTDKPQWDGTPIPDGNLLLVADQGFGDVIQFMRYIPWAEALCPNIVIACSTELQGLLRQVTPRARLFQSWADRPDYVAFAALSGLPRLHKTRVETIPAPIPYLHPDPARVAQWKARLDRMVPAGLRRIGVIWAGRPAHSNDHNRSAVLTDFRPIADVPGVALIALQKGPKTREAGGYYGRAPLINIGAEVVDYDDTMAILANVERLVTVDTSVAHLSGAIGRPAWIMVPRAPDWRWLMEREDTPWYPSIRLFRQTNVRDWRDVAERIAAALAAVAPEQPAI